MPPTSLTRPTFDIAQYRQYGRRETDLKKLVIHPERCKACGYCIQFCPKKVLAFRSDFINTKGYSPAGLAGEGCITCGTCYLMCPDYVFELNEEGGAE